MAAGTATTTVPAPTRPAASVLRLGACIVLVAAVYFGVAELGLQLSFVKGNVTPVFPAAGIAVAAVVLGGVRVWPGVLLGALAAHLTTDVGVGTAIAMSAGGPLAAVAAATALRSPRAGFQPQFASVRAAIAFVLAGVLLPASISAICGVTALFVGSGLSFDGYLVALGSWWVGDAIGAMVAGSLVLAWSAPALRATRSAIETGALLVLAVGLTAVIFTWASEGEALLLPVLVVTAVRLQTRWTVLGVGAVSLIAAYATANAHGPFVESTENASLVQLSLFLGAATLTTLVLSAAMTERDSAGDKAHHDELTGLPNRLFLFEQLDAAIARRQPFTLLFLDVDGLKAVNDTLGHDGGDELLVAIGARIAMGLRRGDVAARLAGDEFTVVAFEASTPDAAAIAGQRVLDCLAPPFEVRGHFVAITGSIGAAVCAGTGEPAALLRTADSAMYEAKRNGGNAVSVALPGP